MRFRTDVDGRSAFALIELLRSVLLPGVDPVTALRDAAARIGNRGLAADLARMAGEIERGVSVSDSLESVARWLQPELRALIRAGLIAGEPEPMLDTCGRWLERRSRAHHAVRDAVTGPLIVVAVSSLVACIIAPLLLPEVAALARDGFATGPIPWSVRAATLVAARQWLPSALLASAVALIGIAVAIGRTRAAGHLWHRMRLRLPLLGPLERSRVAAEASGVAAILLGAGISPPRVLEHLSGLDGNRWVSRMYRRRIARAEAADPVGQLVFLDGLFPESARSILVRGDRTSTLPEASRRLQRELEERCDVLLAATRPALHVAATVASALPVVVFIWLFHLSLLHAMFRIQ